MFIWEIVVRIAVKLWGMEHTKKNQPTALISVQIIHTVEIAKANKFDNKY